MKTDTRIDEILEITSLVPSSEIKPKIFYFFLNRVMKPFIFWEIQNIRGQENL